MADWSYKIDGTELNTGAPFVVSVPEIDNVSDSQVVLADVDGDYPVFIRTQPVDAVYTFLIAMTSCSNSTFNSRIATLKSIFSSGIHVFTAQARGAVSATSVTIVVEGMMIQPKERLVSVKTLAPKPVFA